MYTSKIYNNDNVLFNLIQPNKVCFIVIFVLYSQNNRYSLNPEICFFMQNKLFS